jgi:3',5'-cyclic AMP phosphodiesterase CpdA
MPPKPLKFAVIADVHIGDAQESVPKTRYPERARSLLRYVVSQLNTEHKPDFVVQLGDVIQASSPDDDEDNLSTAAEILGDLQMPVYHTIGNHEQFHLSPQNACSTLKIAKPYYSFECAPLRGVVLFPEKESDEFSIGDEQLKWLEQQLRNSESQVLIFSHFPLVDYPEDDAQEAGEDAGSFSPPLKLTNRSEVRHVLAQSSKVRAVFSGHWHKNSLEELGGIHYIAIQSLVQAALGSRLSESFAIAKIFPDQASVEVLGMDPAEFRI